MRAGCRRFNYVRRRPDSARPKLRRMPADQGQEYVMNAYEVPELDPQPRDSDGHGYIDFLASDKLSVGLAIWPRGVIDRQKPHQEDEVYYVISGRGTIRVAGEDREVRPGSLVFVGAGVEHRFHEIDEDLRVLVFWAPPHGAPPRAR